jgi:hypothetical protein
MSQLGCMCHYSSQIFWICVRVSIIGCGTQSYSQKVKSYSPSPRECLWKHRNSEHTIEHIYHLHSTINQVNSFCSYKWYSLVSEAFSHDNLIVQFAKGNNIYLTGGSAVDAMSLAKVRTFLPVHLILLFSTPLMWSMHTALHCNRLWLMMNVVTDKLNRRWEGN